MYLPLAILSETPPGISQEIPPKIAYGIILPIISSISIPGIPRIPTGNLAGVPPGSPSGNSLRNSSENSGSFFQVLAVLSKISRGVLLKIAVGAPLKNPLGVHPGIPRVLLGFFRGVPLRIPLEEFIWDFHQKVQKKSH